MKCIKCNYLQQNSNKRCPMSKEKGLNNTVPVILLSKYEPKCMYTYKMKVKKVNVI